MAGRVMRGRGEAGVLRGITNVKRESGGHLDLYGNGVRAPKSAEFRLCGE